MLRKLFRRIVGKQSQFGTVATLGRAYRYATGQTTEDDAFIMKRELSGILGNYPLVSLSYETVLQEATQRWGTNPALDRLADEACRFVHDKWCSSGSELDAAQDQAMQKIEEYAKEDGVELFDNYELTPRYWGIGPK